MNTEALFWELASPDRMAILKLLRTGKRRLTRIAEEVGVTVQEAHRDLARLTKARLVAKDPQGYYALTPLGKYVMTLLEPLEALLEHRDYYAAHDLTRIPKNLLYRIGQLKGARQAPDTFTALSYAEILIKEAREYLWILTEQVLPSAARLMQGKNIQIRIVIPRVQPPPSAEPLKLANLEARYIDQIAAALVINEKKSGPSTTTPQRRNRLPRAPNRNPRRTRMVQRPIQTPLEQSKANINQRQLNSHDHNS